METLPTLPTLVTATPSYPRGPAAKYALQRKIHVRTQKATVYVYTLRPVGQRQLPTGNDFSACRRCTLRGDVDAHRLRCQRSVALTNDNPLVRTDSRRVDDTCDVVKQTPAVYNSLRNVLLQTRHCYSARHSPPLNAILCVPSNVLRNANDSVVLLLDVGYISSPSESSIFSISKCSTELSSPSLAVAIDWSASESKGSSERIPQIRYANPANPASETGEQIQLFQRATPASELASESSTFDTTSDGLQGVYALCSV